MLSQALRELGRYEEAADTAHRILMLEPKNYDALMAASKAHIEGNKAFYSIELLHLAQDIRPDDWHSYSLLGVALDQVKRPEEAQAAWATALKLSPNNPVVLANMAMAFTLKGSYAEAETLLRQAVAQKEAGIQIRQDLALILALENKMSEAEQLMRRDLPPEAVDANLKWLAELKNPNSVITPHNWGSLKNGS